MAKPKSDNLTVGDPSVAIVVSRLHRRALLLMLRPIVIWSAAALVVFALWYQRFSLSIAYLNYILWLCLGLLAISFFVSLYEVVVRRPKLREIESQIDRALGLKDRVVTLSKTHLSEEQRTILNKQVEASLSTLNPAHILPNRLNVAEICVAGFALIAFVLLAYLFANVTRQGELATRLSQLSNSDELSPEAKKAIEAVVKAAQNESDNLSQKISEAEAALQRESQGNNSHGGKDSRDLSSSSQSFESSRQSSDQVSSDSSSSAASEQSSKQSSAGSKGSGSSQRPEGSSGSKEQTSDQSDSGSSTSGKGNAQADDSSGQSSNGNGSGSNQSGSGRSGEGAQQSQGDGGNQSDAAQSTGDKSGSASGGNSSGAPSSGSGGQNQNGSQSAGQNSSGNQSEQPSSAKEEALQILSEMKDSKAGQNSSGQGGSQKSAGGSQVSMNNSKQGGSSSGVQSSSGGKKPGNAGSQGSAGTEANQSAGSGDGKKGGVSSQAAAKRFEDGNDGEKKDRNEKFEEKSLTPKDEKLDERFTNGGGELSKDENARPGQKLTIGDLERAKPESFETDDKQRIPREYEGILRNP